MLDLLNGVAVVWLLAGVLGHVLVIIGFPRVPWRRVQDVAMGLVVSSFLPWVYAADRYRLVPSTLQGLVLVWAAFLVATTGRMLTRPREEE